MIDPNLPLELDDGTPVVNTRVYDGTVYIQVRLPAKKSPKRRGRDSFEAGGTFNYNSRNGFFVGDSGNNYFTLRNVDNPSDYEFDI